MINLTFFLKGISLAVDFMHSMGKMYVVVAVVVLVLIGLFVYLTNIDRRITKAEKLIKKNNG